MKKLWTLLVLFCVATMTMLAQKERNYIYILDCSNSMLDNHVGSQTLWDATLDYLQKDIDRQTATSTINIVPFQGKVYPVWTGQKKKFDWAKFKKEVYDYPKTLTGTNICAAWDEALSLQDHNKDNYIYLLTDGEDNKMGVDAVCKRIREWCQKNITAYGYYVMLANDAMNPRIIEEVEHCHKMFVVRANEGLNPFGSIEGSDMVYNTLDPQELEFQFSTAGTFKASVENTDENFDVELVDGQITEGKARIRITVKESLETLPEVIRLTPEVISSDVNVVNPNLNIVVNNVPERLLTLPSQEVDMGEAEWYDSFLWSDAKQKTPLTVDLNPIYNQAAIKDGTSFDMILKSRDKDGNVIPLEKDVTVLVNGEKNSMGMFEMKAGQPAVLTFIYDDEAKSGKHYYELSVVPGSSQNLERINSSVPSDYSLSLRADYDVDMNPLKVAMIWLGIILLTALLLWFLLLRRLVYPTIKAKSVEFASQPVQRSATIKGCRKVVFTNKKQRQGLMSRIFTGEVKYVRDDMFDSEWYILPTKNRNKVKAMRTTGYMLNPPSTTLERLQPVTFKNTATNRIIKITIK